MRRKTGIHFSSSRSKQCFIRLSTVAELALRAWQSNLKIGLEPLARYVAEPVPAGAVRTFDDQKLSGGTRFLSKRVAYLHRAQAAFDEPGRSQAMPPLAAEIHDRLLDQVVQRDYRAMQIVANYKNRHLEHHEN